MRIINLTNLEKSEIKYKIQKFPDGQQNIVIQTFKDDQGSIWVGEESNRFKMYDVKIISHLNNWLDLELIVATVASLRELGVDKIHLVTPYFIEARSDRKFEDGGNWYLKQVIGPIINNLKLASILVLDPHSWVLGNVLDRFKYINNSVLVKWALVDIIIKNKNLNSQDIIYLAPDAGASHKIYKSLEEAKVKDKKHVVICSKERDNNGKLTETIVPIPIMDANYLDKTYVIIDDICDGGRTFSDIVKAVKEKGYDKEKFYLIVTHGIFSAGFEELAKNFDGIYCTNSYSNLKSGEDLQQTAQKICKQLNVYV